MDGLTALKTMMANRPVPVVMFSSLTHKGAQVTLDALSLGAVDFLPKPASGFELDDAAEELCRKVLASAQARPRFRTGRLEEDSPAEAGALPFAVRRNATPCKAGSLREAESLVVIGSSTGGPQALEDLVPHLPAGLPSGVIVCQHMPAGFTSSMAKRLDAVSALSVREAASGETVMAGEVLVAPGGYHLRVLPGGSYQAAKVATDDGPQVHGVKPAVDVTLLDAAAIYGDRLMVVILSGMGVDGAQGAKAAKDRGAKVIVQDEGTSVVWGMPKACYEMGICDKVLPLGYIVDEIARFS
jgi:two-component system chemotaxis response regulator CheB